MTTDMVYTRLKDISVSVQHVYFKTTIREAFFSIIQNDKWNILPVIDDEKIVVGQIERNSFIEHIILGRYGYGIHLNGRKFVYEVMEEPRLVFESDENVEEVAIKLKDYKHLPTNIIVVENGKLLGAAYVSFLLEALAQKNLMLMKDANPLTGLPGNWAIKREVERRISAGELFEVIYIDINNFKPFNDNYGFAKGDEVIFTLGEVIKDVKSRYEGVFAGHIGGDDFILVCPPNTSMQVAEEIKNMFEKHLIDFHGEDYSSGFYFSKDRNGVKKKFPLLSLSFAIVSNEHRNITSYAHLASIATEVKNKAKSLAKVSQSSVIFKDRRRDSSSYLESDLDLSNIVIEMYFQPVVDLSSSKVVGFEALARGINKETNVMISSNILFDLAEKNNSLLEFDRLCKDLAMRKFKDFGLEKDFLLFLNVSSETVNLGLLDLDWIKKKAEHYGISPGSIVIEVNECKIHDVENLLSFVKKYKDYGFSIALDDFGTSESNIERLLLVEPHYIKLARNFIEDIHKDAKKQKLLKFMRLLSEEFNTSLILEGVETLEEFYFIRHQGIKLAQGYFFAHPQPNPKQAALLAEEKLRE